MTLGGNLDYGGQAAQSARFLTALAVDTVGAQTFDISALIGPQDQALLVYWVASLGFTGLPCGVIAQTVSPQVFFSGHTQLADGGQAILPYQGAVELYPTDIGGQIVVDNIGPGPIHIVGTLFVSAIVGPPYTIPIVRRPYIGQGLTTGNVTVTAGLTSTVLPAPSAGTYYRLKLFTWSLNVAPAAATKFIWQRLSDGAQVLSTSVPVAASQQSAVAMDLEWDDGIKALNQTSVNIPCNILYELWQA